MIFSFLEFRYSSCLKFVVNVYESFININIFIVERFSFGFAEVGREIFMSSGFWRVVFIKFKWCFF